MITLIGDHHRKQRKLLNPVFSIAHMRRMIPLFNEVGLRVSRLSHPLVRTNNPLAHPCSQLQKAIELRVAGKGDPIELDMATWMGRTALELIGRAGLGYSFDPLVTDKPDDFGTAVKNLQ